MELRTWVGIVLGVLGVLGAASCERSKESPRSPGPGPAPETATAPASERATAPAGMVGSGAPTTADSADSADSADTTGAANAAGPRVMQVPPSGSAGDDFPHRKRELAWLAKARDCVPPRDDTVTLALDAYDGRLVLCAQAMTRRDVSVFFDEVSYACWNLDPATAAVSRRADLGRAYFRCQDGTCQAGDFNKAISYDGTEEIVLTEATQEVSIRARPAGTLVRSFKGPAAFAGQELLRGHLTLVGHTIFAVFDYSILVLDDRGGARGKLEGIDLHVVDEGHVLAIRDIEGQHATLYELATRKATPIALTAKYLAGAVRHGGTFFAVDGDARKLVTLDPKTLQPRRALPLPICK